MTKKLQVIIFCELICICSFSMVPKWTNAMCLFLKTLVTVLNELSKLSQLLKQHSSVYKKLNLFYQGLILHSLNYPLVPSAIFLSRYRSNLQGIFKIVKIEFQFFKFFFKGTNKKFFFSGTFWPFRNGIYVPAPNFFPLKASYWLV